MMLAVLLSLSIQLLEKAPAMESPAQPIAIEASDGRWMNISIGYFAEDLLSQKVGLGVTIADPIQVRLASGETWLTPSVVTSLAMAVVAILAMFIGPAVHGRINRRAEWTSFRRRSHMEWAVDLRSRVAELAANLGESVALGIRGDDMGALIASTKAHAVAARVRLLLRNNMPAELNLINATYLAMAMCEKFHKDRLGGRTADSGDFQTAIHELEPATRPLLEDAWKRAKAWKVV